MGLFYKNNFLSLLTSLNILFSEVDHQVMECFRVDVFTNLHQYEPISKPDLLHDEVNISAFRGAGATLENVGTDGTEKVTPQYFWLFSFTFYLEMIVMILKQKKMLVQLSTRRYQNHRKK